MKNCKYLITVSVIIITLFSCKKDNSETPVKTVPVEWVLSAQDKNLFNAFSNNMFVQYSDGSNNILNFQADGIHSITTCPENNFDKGESLIVNYDCLSNYFPNYFYHCQLTARPDQSVDMYIYFATGTYHNDRNNDYVTSTFLFNPNDPLDTLSGLGIPIHQTYLDSITLRDTMFYNVFLDSNMVFNTDVKQTIKCYYTVNSGVVAFENLDGKLWIRK